MTKSEQRRADVHRLKAERDVANRSADEARLEQGKLRAELADAVDALQELYDWQNGPPLESQKWLDGWGGAMKKAEAVLQAAEAGAKIE